MTSADKVGVKERVLRYVTHVREIQAQRSSDVKDLVQRATDLKQAHATSKRDLEDLEKTQERVKESIVRI